MASKLVAGLFIVAFFAALPLWFLSTLDGWIEVRCGGPAPWRCSVEKWNLLSRRASTMEVNRASWGTRTVSYRTRTSEQYVLKFNGYDVLDSRPGYDEVSRLADDIEAARRDGRTIERSLPPDGVFWLAIGLVVVFAASGLAIAIGGAREQSPPRSR